MTTHDDDAVEGNKNTGRHGRWDPFKTFRRVLSPEERMDLLRVDRPVQPPEDFMNTVELKLMRSAQLRDQLRYLSPALIGLGILLVVLVVAVLWWHAPSVSPASAAAPASESPALSARSPEAPAPTTNPASNSEGTAQASRPVPSFVPAVGAVPPAPGVTPPRHASPTPTSANPPRRTAPTTTSAAQAAPAPKLQPRTPEDLDLDTPMAPPVH